MVEVGATSSALFSSSLLFIFRRRQRVCVFRRLFSFWHQPRSLLHQGGGWRVEGAGESEGMAQSDCP